MAFPTRELKILLSVKEPDKHHLWLRPHLDKEGYDLLYWGNNGWTNLDICHHKHIHDKIDILTHGKKSFNELNMCSSISIETDNVIEAINEKIAELERRLVGIGNGNGCDCEEKIENVEEKLLNIENEISDIKEYLKIIKDRLDNCDQENSQKDVLHIKDISYNEEATYIGFTKYRFIENLIKEKNKAYLLRYQFGFGEEKQDIFIDKNDNSVGGIYFYVIPEGAYFNIIRNEVDGNVFSCSINNLYSNNLMKYIGYFKIKKEYLIEDGKYFKYTNEHNIKEFNLRIKGIEVTEEGIYTKVGEPLMFLFYPLEDANHEYSYTLKHENVTLECTDKNIIKKIKYVSKVSAWNKEKETIEIKQPVIRTGDDELKIIMCGPIVYKGYEKNKYYLKETSLYVRDGETLEETFRNNISVFQREYLSTYDSYWDKGYLEFSTDPFDERIELNFDMYL